MSADDPAAGPGDEQELERLRRLLIGLDGEDFAALVRSVRDPGQRTLAVAEVLSEAVAWRAQADESLGDTLAPTIEGALHRSIDRNPEPIANAIYPVIGPSVRKAITAAITDMVQTLNRTVEQQFSPQALRWRYQAWRGGLTYTEFLFANNINYTIDHAFLFHRETSLLLQHVARDPEFEADSDMVSSMLSAMTTALTDFMHDSFSSDSDGSRRAMSVDEHNIYVQAGEFAVVALVTRGTPPAAKHGAMTDFMDRTHVAHRESLRGFEGDATVFAALRPGLEDLLRVSGGGEGAEADAGGVRRPAGWPFMLVAAFVLLAIGGWFWRDHGLAAEAAALRAALDATPGYALLHADRDGADFRIEGLRDPLAADFGSLRDAHVARLSVTSDFKPYFSADPQLSRARLLAALSPPMGVEAEIVGGVLRVSGVADADWLTQARVLVAGSNAVRGLDAAALEVAATDAQQLTALRAGLERERLYFEPNNAELSAPQAARLRAVALEIGQLAALGSIENLDLRVVVIGQSDGTGTLETNRIVSQERAEAVMAALVAAGAPEAMLEREARIIGDVNADARQVRFEVLESVTN